MKVFCLNMNPTAALTIKVKVFVLVRNLWSATVLHKVKWNVTQDRYCSTGTSKGVKKKNAHIVSLHVYVRAWDASRYVEPNVNVQRRQSDGRSAAAVLKRCTLCTLTAGETRLFMQSILFLHSFKEENSLFSAALVPESLIPWLLLLDRQMMIFQLLACHHDYVA